MPAFVVSDYPHPLSLSAIIRGPVGAWRSLVAHLHGVQGVGGSNPLAPTSFPISLNTSWLPRITPRVRHERTGNTLYPHHRADGGLRRRHEGRHRAGGGKARGRVARVRRRGRPGRRSTATCCCRSPTLRWSLALSSHLEPGNSPTRWRSASARPTVRADLPSPNSLRASLRRSDWPRPPRHRCRKVRTS